MSCGRGEGKDTTMWFYNRKIGTLYGVQYIERHIRWLEMQEIRFNLACMNHQRVWGKPTSDLLRLKKPIMPHRWISYREGWCSEAWGFTNADLTPYALKEAADKLVEQIRDPNFKQVLRALWLPEGFTLGKERR